MGGYDLLTIKDFAKLTGIKESSLRYYDKLGLFSPSERGENSYRYYTPQQIITINTLRLLHELDMPIKEISELERNRTPGRMMDVLTDKETELETAIRRLTESFNVIKTRRKMIQQGMSVESEKLDIEYMDEQSIALGPVNSFGEDTDFYRVFLRYCKDAEDYRVDLRYPVGGYFNNLDDYLASPSQPSQFYSVDPTGADKKPAGKYLVGYVRGYYGETKGLEKKMRDWINKNGVRAQGPVYNVYLMDEISLTDPNQYLMQASVRIE